MNRVATFNVHDSWPPVRRSLDTAGLILWQEFPRHVPAAWAATAGWDLRAGGDGQTCTGWMLRWWDYLSYEWHPAHAGRAHVTPARGTLVVKLRHRHTGVRVAVVNGHRINRTRGAWLAVPGVHARWRAERWREHDRLDRELVAELVDDGWVVIGGGDYNRRRMALPHPQAYPLAGRGSIDKLWAVDVDERLQLVREGVERGLGSDHDLRWAKVAVRHG